MSLNPQSQRKIIHIDMDCFYAAIEIRDNPALANKPVAVGGPASERSVLCTCNYIARKFGIKSAMPTSYAERLCPDLIILPVNMQKYREVANVIHSIFLEFTDLVEPLSLDEAYLDVSNSIHCQGSATWIAEKIRQKIFAEIKITASAGVAPNKFLAKIASGWKKPNGLFVIKPQDIKNFIVNLPITELHGVGKVTSEKLTRLNLKTCSDLQKLTLGKLTELFGKFGTQLYEQSRGIDNRPVEPDRTRKSLSVERTFKQDIKNPDDCISILHDLYHTLVYRLHEQEPNRRIKNQYLKIKYSNFKVATLEKISSEPSILGFKNLFAEIKNKNYFSIRLLGIGVHFRNEEKLEIHGQQSFLI